MTAVTAPAGTRLRHRAAQHRAVLPILAIFLLVVAGFGATTEHFFTTNNIVNVLRQGAPLVIVAIGATFVLVSAGIDLSIGAMVSVTGVVTALLFKLGLPAEVVLPMALLIAAGVGAANGFLIAFQRLPSFIVTLGTLSILSGSAQMLGRGFSIPVVAPDWVIAIGQGRIGLLPLPVILAFLAAFAGWIVLNRTAYGLRIRGIGSNAESVRRSGARVDLLVTSVYMISSVTAAIAGIVVAMRLQSGGATAGTGMELQAIAAVVLGGTSLFGGKGSIVGTVLGVYTLGFIENGLILNHVDPFYVRIIQGAILLAALWANTRLFSRLG
ncbi:ABC transporter permease [Methylobrevis albus]|uniref:ABC transporter permease n=1 Tax=Methylobrevis albus TaxID=2793297 RepID=A0A931I6V4_9HYPH|nr:ABC transporter permease [Methylobrevis albus]MBH0239893.1 ABC transporter permease [Methylobrevis albus]